MNFLLENWMLLTMALASGLGLLLPVLKKGGGLDPQAMVQLMNREKAVVIEVCERDQLACGHVIGANNRPLALIDEKSPQWGKHKATTAIRAC